MTNICVDQLFIYPFKGLSAHGCDRVDLEVGHGIRGDRAFALMYKEDAIYPDTTKVPWMKKQNFAMQNDWSGLAALDCAYEAATGTLTVKRKGVELLVADTLSHTMQLGTARIVVTDRINRCLNIDVNPDTGERDIAALSLLQKHFRHTQTGVLAKVITSGTLGMGDRLSVAQEKFR